MKKVTFKQLYNALTAVGWATYGHTKTPKGEAHYIAPHNENAVSREKMKDELFCTFGKRIGFIIALPQYAPELSRFAIVLKSLKTLNEEVTQ
jgi:hypothetical protein